MSKPSEEYTIHILEDEDFDKLPFGKPKEALGMSNAETKTAWVRRTHVKEMDTGTINHEFDELMAKTSLHEIDGIRYKGFKDFFRTVFNAVLPGVGSAIFKPKPPPQPKQPSFVSPFLPQTASATGASQAAKPLSEQDFQTGLGNIDKNLKTRETDIFRRVGFRGQTEAQNTALARALGNARQSSAREREDFISQQEEAKRSAGI